jgi:hypothetical protein
MDAGTHSQLQHACGYKLANDGKNVENTVRSTELVPKRF